MLVYCWPSRTWKGHLYFALLLLFRTSHNFYCTFVSSSALQSSLTLIPHPSLCCYTSPQVCQARLSGIKGAILHLNREQVAKIRASSVLLPAILPSLDIFGAGKCVKHPEGIRSWPRTLNIVKTPPFTGRKGSIRALHKVSSH